MRVAGILPRLRVRYAAAALLLTLLPAAALGQPISDDPHAPRYGASLIRSDFLADMYRLRPHTMSEDAATGTPTLVGDVRLGASPTVVRVGRFALDVEAGVYARFMLETRSSDLVSTDWIFSIPVSYQVPWAQLEQRLGCDDSLRDSCRIAVELGYKHHSAHAGDEFFVGVMEAPDYSRDGLTARVLVSGTRMSAQAALDHAPRAWGAPAASSRMVEAWIQPAEDVPVRVGTLWREIPGAADAYQSAYLSIDLNIFDAPVDLRARWARGGIPIGQAWGGNESVLGLEIIVM